MKRMTPSSTSESNNLEVVLRKAGGIEFGAAFLGKYLGFRDAWAVACTSRVGYETFHTKSYLQTYIRHRILKPFPIFDDDGVDCLTLLNHFPIGQVEFPDVAHVHNLLHTANAPMISHQFADRARQEAVPPLELESAVRHVNRAAKIVHHGHQRKSPEEQIPIITRISAKKKRRTQKKLDLSYKPSHYDWPAHLSTILVDWANGQAGKIGDWEPGSWSHQVLRFLTHAVDLESSIWQPYLKDPRYLGYYRHYCFDIFKKSALSDFWLLVNDLYSNPGGTVTKKQPLTTLYHSRNPSLRNRIFSGDGATFSYMYSFHAMVAQTIRDNALPPLVLDLEDALGIPSVLQGQVVKSTGGRPGQLRIRNTSQYGTAVLVEKSPLVPPDLVAVVDFKHWYPMNPGWSLWWPAIQEILV